MNPSRKRPREMLDDALTWRVKRSLPSTNVLVALSTSSQRKVIPLLRGLVAEEEIEAFQEEDTNLAAIDNPKNSTLTKGQHERYRALKNDPHKARWTGQQRREYRKLQGLVNAEQHLYRQARHTFLVQNEARFLSGFLPGKSATEYATWHSKYTQAYIDKWNSSGFPLCFGKVRQIVSLSHYDDDATNWMPSEVFDSLVLKRGSQLAPATDLSKSIPPMKAAVAYPFLRDDEVALKLAKEHGASVIVSSEAFEQILTQSSWKIPLWNCEDGTIRILDEPIPQSVLPRECLTKGLEVALRDNNESCSSYTLLTVNVRGRVQQIIIRGCSSSRRVRVHLEYFPQRGVEQLSPEELSLWILDSLVEPLGSMQMVRINVEDWSMQQAETVSVAHALASGNDVMEPWKRLLLLLNALDSMPKTDDYILSCQEQSVSLHQADDKGTDIALREHFKKADAVKTGSAALSACSREWNWVDNTRAEKTFPISTNV